MWARNVRAEGLSLGRLAGALDRRRWLALGVFVALLAPAAAWVAMIGPRYLGSMRLLVKNPAPPGSGGMTASSEMQQTIEGLRDPELLQRASAALGLGAEGVSRLAQD
ncbi:MAG: hypothetical protein KDC27_01165, partial [Acidobacteria bacterium]|nr:hypothetical protein [Acidobacteriota bacterium]